MENKQFDFLTPSVFGLDNEENWSNVLIDLAKIKEGDVFYECDHGKNVKLVATTNATPSEQGWFCNVKNENYGEKKIYISAGTTYLSANLFAVPQILTEHKGQLGFVVE